MTAPALPEDLATAERTPSLAVFTGLLAVAALLTPLWAPQPDCAAGLLLVGGVGAEVVQSFRRRTAAGQHGAWASAGYTLLLALVLLNESWLAAAALAVFAAVPFALDALRRAGAAVRLAFRGRPFLSDVWAACGNLVAVAAVLLIGRYARNWVIGAAAGLRLFTVTVNLVTASAYSDEDVDESVIADIGLDQPERLAETGARLQAAERDRVVVDRGWITALVAVLFAIHVSRMGFDKSALGILSPMVAVVGDIVVALALTYFVIVPFRLFCRRTTRWLERRAWDRVLAVPGRTGVAAWQDRALRWWLQSRMRFAIRLRAARVLADVRVRPWPADRLAAHRGHRRLGSHLGHELVLRHGELGGGRLELLGRVADGRLARGHGPSGRRRRPDDARRAGLCRHARRRRRRAFLLHRHRRHGRG